YERRATETFHACEAEIDARLDAMLAEHSAKGLLKSGATAKRSVEIYEEESRQALGQVLDEMARLVEHRGREWTAATAAIGKALDAHSAKAREVLDKPLGIAGAKGDTAAAQAIDRLLGKVANHLRTQLNEFHEGWTAPVPKS